MFSKKQPLNMKCTNIFVNLFFLLLSSIAVGQKLADPILLWPGGAPGATGIADEDKPAIIPFIPEASKRNGAAVLVIPGGAFTLRAVDHEGVLVAQWLKDHGITAFLLRYRLKPLYNRTHWVRDGQRAIQYIRSHANEYHISANRVGAIGFSAGADLIVDMSINPLPVVYNAIDPLEHFSARNDFMILAYGSMQIPQSLDSSNLKSLPPTFMFCTAEDASHMDGMIGLYKTLFHAKVPVEAHFFRNGVHGTGFAIGDPILGEWPKLMNTWLLVSGFLTDKIHYPISGVVKLDGVPLVRGMVILTPVKQPTASPVISYITNTGTGEPGKFSLSADQGPVAGKYRVEVRQDATRWTSNSRDPFMIKMMKKQSDNSLTDDDIKEWEIFLRKRDLSPSIYNQRVFYRQHPNDQKDYIIVIKEGNKLLLEVFSK
jgi:acetyl esterase/lipase